MPELVAGGPAIPVRLLNELDNGKVVFFCGAGVSMGPGSDLPDFADLVQHVYIPGTGRGSAGKAAVIGVKDRETGKVSATRVSSTDSLTLGNFVAKHANFGTTVYTDEASAYNVLDPWYHHESVKHSVSEYVRGQAHTQGIESFWSMLKCGYNGTYHKMSEKHLDRYVREFAGRHNVREHDTITQMASLTAGMVGKRVRYRELIADNGLESGARS